MSHEEQLSSGIKMFACPPFGADEHDRWRDYLRRCDDDNRHFAYVLEAELKPWVKGVSVESIWGHPDYKINIESPHSQSLVPHGRDELISEVVAPNMYHNRGIYPQGHEERAIPLWVYLAIEADEVVYVGETKNIENRYDEHVNRVNSPQLFRFFKPTGRILFLADCLPRNPGEVERDIAMSITSVGSRDWGYIDWDEINTFAYSGVSGTRFDTDHGWSVAPEVVKEHQGWQNYWSNGGYGTYCPLNDD